MQPLSMLPLAVNAAFCFTLSVFVLHCSHTHIYTFFYVAFRLLIRKLTFAFKIAADCEARCCMNENTHTCTFQQAYRVCWDDPFKYDWQLRNSIAPVESAFANEVVLHLSKVFRKFDSDRPKFIHCHAVIPNDWFVCLWLHWCVEVSL